jgi:hypothetical protein
VYSKNLKKISFKKPNELELRCLAWNIFLWVWGGELYTGERPQGHHGPLVLLNGFIKLLCRFLCNNLFYVKEYNRSQIPNYMWCVYSLYLDCSNISFYLQYKRSVNLLEYSLVRFFNSKSPGGNIFYTHVTNADHDQLAYTWIF